MMTTILNSERISLQGYAEQQGLNVQDAVRSMTGKLVLELRDLEIVSRRPTRLEGLNRRLISASSLITNYDLNGKVVEELRIGDSKHHFCGLVELLDPVPRKDGVEYRNFKIHRTDEVFPLRLLEGVCCGYQHGNSVITPYEDLMVEPALAGTPPSDEHDFSLLATRHQLIEAFGTFTGMNMTWFDNLKDTPKLKDARKFTGQGGRCSAEPLFCPLEVLLWLVEPKRKKGRKLNDKKGWSLLKVNFPRVYNLNSIGDPNVD